jgi:Family of unknown function (DUF6065)
MSAAEAQPDLVAYHTTDHPPVELEPAPRFRGWMSPGLRRGTGRCLPLLMASEHGWVLKNPMPFTAVWDGTESVEGVRVDYPDGKPSLGVAGSRFGGGTLTFNVPYVFRTVPGVNLLARGPSNWPKDGIAALEGLVETDWSVASFTMNWKITRPDHPVTFEQGEPYCMVVPQPRGLLESFTPAFRPMAEDAELHEGHHMFLESRRELNRQKFLSIFADDFKDARNAWQKQYFRGHYPNGDPAPEHQTKLRLGHFEAPARKAASEV